MLRKIGMFLLYVALGNEAYANTLSESQKFIGLETSITEVQGAQPSNTSDDVSYGLRLGAENEEWRTMFVINYYDSDVHNVEKAFLALDYFFLKSNTANNYALQPYLGLNVGYMNYESSTEDVSGLIYGGQAGIVLDVMSNIDLDVGYRYSLSSSDEFDHTGEVIFGINYKF